MTFKQQQVEALMGQHKAKLQKMTSKELGELIHEVNQGNFMEPPKELGQQDFKSLQITKTAIVKSLLESGTIAEYSEEAENKLINPWVKYIYRNTQEDFNLINQ